MCDDALNVPGRPVDDDLFEREMTRDRMGSRDGLPGSNQYAVPLTGHVDESRKLRPRNPILRVIDVVPNHDGVSRGGRQKQREQQKTNHVRNLEEGQRLNLTTPRSGEGVDELLGLTNRRPHEHESR